MEKGLINHFTWLSNKLSESYVYENWSAELVKKEVKEAFDTFYKSLQKESNLKLIDWDNLTAETVSELRFGRWDSDEDIDQEIEAIKNENEDSRSIYCSYDGKPKTKEERIKLLENTRNLRLIPLWLYPLIPIGMELISISGEKVKNDGKLDNDIRFGCTAYGVQIKEA